VLIDVGVETSAKTFSSHRYDIWTMQSAFHNLPTINGVMQAAGRQYAAHEVSFRSDDAGAEFIADIAAAYPKAAGVQTWVRSILTGSLGQSSDRGGPLCARGRGRIEMSLMTPRPARAAGPGVLALDAGARIAVEGVAVPEFRIEEIATTDPRLQSVWGDRIYRVLAVWPSSPGKGELKFTIAPA
jgi:hypothetical protein